MPFDGEFWEERLVRPVDIYPRFRAMGPEVLPRAGDGAYRIETYFVEIESDEGVIGIGGPIPRELAFLIDVELKPYLLGADPLANELVWDTLYRASVHGRKGLPMMAISAVDCALWDAKGRYFNAPVYRLLGGPSRVEDSRLTPAHWAIPSSLAAPPTGLANSCARASKPPSGSSAMGRQTGSRA